MSKTFVFMPIYNIAASMLSDSLLLSRHIRFEVSPLQISAWKIKDSSYLLKVLRCENSNCNLEVVSFVNAVRDNDSYQFRSNNAKIPTIKHMIMSYFLSSYVKIDCTNDFDIFYKIQISYLLMVYWF